MERSDLDPEFIIIKKNTGKSEYFLYRTGTRQVQKGSLITKNNQEFISAGNKIYATTKIFIPKFKKGVNKDYEIFFGKDEKLNTNTQNLNQISDHHNIPTSNLTSVLETDDNDILVSTLGSGILKLQKVRSKTIFEIKSLDDRKIFFNKGHFYFISEGKLSVLDRESKLTEFNFSKLGIVTGFLNGDKFYLGDFDGITEYNLNFKTAQLKKIKTYPFTYGVSQFVCHNNKIYFSTYGEGIKMLGDQVKDINSKLPVNSIESMTETANGFAAISYQDGFMLLDNNFNLVKHYNKKNGLPSNFVTTVFQDGKTLWVGMRNKIAYIVNGKIYSFPDFGLLHNKGMILNIFKDRLRNLWVISEKGIFKIHNGEIFPIGSLNILNEENTSIIRSLYIKESNNLVFSTQNEITFINFGKMTFTDRSVKPELYQITLDGEKVPFGDYSFRLGNDYEKFQLAFKSVDNIPLFRTILQYSINGRPWQNFRDDNFLNFDAMNPGEYHIQVRTKNENAKTVYFDRTFNIKVLHPFYMRWWFILLTVILIAGLSALYFNNYNKKKFAQKYEEIRLQNELEHERKRISRDLHDNLGAYTTNLISKVDTIQNENAALNDKLLDIRLSAEKIMSLIRQTIWILGSKETTVENYSDSFKTYTQKYFSSHSQIRPIFMEDIRDERMLDSALAMSMFRIVQEVLQNALKHSKATELKITFISDGKMFMKFEDNGIGFNTKKTQRGNGLKNIAERCRELHIDFKLYSDQNGTVYEFQEL